MADQKFKTIEGGSIDYAHYARKARSIRSQACLQTLRAIAAAVSSRASASEEDVIISQVTAE
jgi:hypothetical protein